MLKRADVRPPTAAIHLSTLCLFLLGGTLLSAQTASSNASSSCESELPPAAKKVVTSKLKGWKILTVADLAHDDQEIFADSYEETCPGIAAGQFAPGQAPSYAVTLIRSRSGVLYQALLVVTDKNRRYQVTTLSPQQRVSAPSIVRKLPRGNYSSPQADTQIAAAFDVIAYEKIQAGTVIYYWSDGKYRSLAIAE